MKTLKRTRYNTMNSWNNTTAPAYNLKIHRVIDDKLQNKVFEMMESEGFYDNINDLMREFDDEHDHEWKAGFNGRSGGYLVLYKGGKKPSGYKSYCTECGQKNYATVPEDKTGVCGRCDAVARVNFKRTHQQCFTYPGRHIDDAEVPSDVLKSFRKLAVRIVKDTEYLAKNYKVVEEEYQVTKTRKVLEEV